MKAKTAPKAAPATAKTEEEIEEVAPVEETEAATEASPEVEEVAVPTKAVPAAAPAKRNLTTTKDVGFGEAEISQPAVTRVDVSQVKNDDLVLVTMHETIDPAPRVGTFDCRHKLKVQALTARKNYRMPKFVAEVLVDAGKAEYLSIE